MATVMTMTNFKKSGLNALLRQMEIGTLVFGQKKLLQKQKNI